MIIDNRYYRIDSIFGYRLRALDILDGTARYRHCDIRGYVVLHASLMPFFLCQSFGSIVTFDTFVDNSDQAKESDAVKHSKFLTCFLTTSPALVGLSTPLPPTPTAVTSSAMSERILKKRIPTDCASF